jgi:hypothetical protein
VDARANPAPRDNAEVTTAHTHTTNSASMDLAIPLTGGDVEMYRVNESTIRKNKQRT